jgi:hypothetical protein
VVGDGEIEERGDDWSSLEDMGFLPGMVKCQFFVSYNCGDSNQFSQEPGIVSESRVVSQSKCISWGSNGLVPRKRAGSSAMSRYMWVAQFSKSQRYFRM